MKFPKPISRRLTKQPKAIWVKTFPRQVQSRTFAGSEKKERLARFAARKRNRIRPISKTAAARHRAYNARVRVWIVGKACAVFPNEIATQCHHKFGRIGKLLFWEPGWLPVTDRGQSWIHENIKLAREMGLICKEGEWNNFEKALQTQAACA